MRTARELFELRPNGLAIAVEPQLAGFQIVFRQIAHLHHESQIAALDGRTTATALEDFHEAAHFLIAFQNAQHQQSIGGIGARRLRRWRIARLTNPPWPADRILRSSLPCCC